MKNYVVRSAFAVIIFAVHESTTYAQIEPVPLPDPEIPGFEFPTPEDVIVEWTETNNQTAINRHAWGLWTALTAVTDQEFNGQQLLVFETWPTPQDIINGSTNVPRPFEVFRQLRRGAESDGEETVLGFVKYNPTATEHIIDHNLLSKAALNRMLASGAKKIPDFPVTAISLKPVFQPIAKNELVDGRYYMMAAWPGPGTPPPGQARPFPFTAWKQCIWIDLQNQGQGNGTVDKVCQPDGSSRASQSTYNLSSFINFRLTAAEAKRLNIQSKTTDVSAGDFAVLQAMHVTSRETTRWTWQTFLWSANPDNPNSPSSKAIAADRPSQLRGAARNYAHAPAYSMVNPPQPNEGGQNKGNSVYAYNPWLEAGFSKRILPDSEPGTFNGRPVPNDVGIMTNCMSCRANANYNPGKLPSAPAYAGDRYI